MATDSAPLPLRGALQDKSLDTQRQLEPKIPDESSESAASTKAAKRGRRLSKSGGVMFITTAQGPSSKRG